VRKRGICIYFLGKDAERVTATGKLLLTGKVRVKETLATGTKKEQENGRILP